MLQDELRFAESQSAAFDGIGVANPFDGQLFVQSFNHCSRQRAPRVALPFL